MHKAGFVNIVGNPNVGKSTLMNQLVGERISIATFKAQTTRHRIMGIVNEEDAQIVFSDTPGVLKPNYKLQESMLAFSESALQDADVLLYVTDVVENPEKNQDFLDKVKRMTIPVLLLINKIDQSDQKTLGDTVERWHQLLPTVPSKGPAHGQARTLLRLGDNTREDTALLRQGDTVLGGGEGGVVQGDRQAHRHTRRDIRGARLAEGHHHRTPGRGAEEDVDRGTQVAREVLRQERISPHLREGGQGLA